MVCAVLRVRRGHGDDFMFLVARIDHGHDTDGSRMHHGERYNRILTKNENIKRVAIFGKRLGNKAVIRGIENCRVEDAVHANHATALVEFVFYIGVQWNFDYGVEFLGDVAAGTQIVPWMAHENLSKETRVKNYCKR